MGCFQNGVPQPGSSQQWPNYVLCHGLMAGMKMHISGWGTPPSKAVKKQPGSAKNAASISGRLPPEMNHGFPFLLSPVPFLSSPVQSLSTSICLYDSAPCSCPVRHKWWYLSFISSVWKSVWTHDETGLTPDCDEDRHFSLIRKNIGSLDLLISINLCRVMNLKMEAHSYRYLRIVFYSKQDSRECHKNQLLMLVGGFMA